MDCVLCKGKGYNTDGIYVTNCELCLWTGKINNYESLEYCLKRMSTEARNKLSDKKLKKLRRKYDKHLLTDNTTNSHYFTVDELLDYIKQHKVPLDAIITQQRVEDIYFEKHGWDTSTEYIPYEGSSDVFDEYVHTYASVYDKERNRLLFTPHY